MATLFALILAPPVSADPLAGILVGGVLGLIAALVGGAFVGTILNVLRRSAGQQFRTRVQGSPRADQDFSEAA